MSRYKREYIVNDIYRRGYIPANQRKMRYIHMKDISRRRYGGWKTYSIHMY